MTPVVAWFRLDLVRRWRSLLVLALLVAFATATVLTAVAGARRGATAVDRLLADTLPATVVVLPNQPGFDWEVVRALPEVESLGTFVVAAYIIDGADADVGNFPLADRETLRTIERPVVLDGRLPDPDRADEVVVSPNFLQAHDRSVGDTVTLRLYSGAQVDELMVENTEPEDTEGPVVEATIVGVVRSGWFGDATQSDAGSLVPSYGLFEAHPESFLGATGTTSVNALARLHGGDAAIPAFKEGLARVSGRNDIDVWTWSELADHFRRVNRFEANSLLAFALAAAVAALFLVGQSITRYAASTVADLRVLRAVGMTPTQSRWAAVLGPALSAVVGVSVGAAVAVVASRWFPIGTAALNEPEPGTSVDALVLGLGVLGIPLLVGAGALGAAMLSLRAAEAGGASRRSAVASAATGYGMPVPVVVGTRFALEPGRGRSAVPVRPALFGAMVGVLGVVAAFTFAHGINDATTNPERFGLTHDLEAFLGYNGFDFAPTEDVLSLLIADPDITGVNDARTDVAQAGRTAVSLFTLDPRGEPIATVVGRGRMPRGPGEVALGPRTASATGLGVGDRVELTGSIGTQTATVTGIAFVPVASHNDYASGGWVTPETYDSLFDGFKFHLALVALRDDADAGAVAARIGEASEGGVGLAPPELPPEVAELEQVRVLPLFLAAFLALLAVGAVGHALATAVHRRRHDLAVLRALGMTRRQSRGLVATQATVLAIAGLAVGVPSGVLVGRTVWRYVADATPVHYLPPVAWLVVLLIVPAAVMVANLLAVWPGWRAATMRVGHVLRSE